MDTLHFTLSGLYHGGSSISASHVLLLGTALLIAGGIVGFLAGLFGIGGGTVIVPVLYEVFGLLSVPEDVRMQLCIGTSLAIIVPTSISSFATHWKKRAVDANVLKAWIAPIILGVLVGIVSARYASPAAFKLAFVGDCIAYGSKAALGRSAPTPRLGLAGWHADGWVRRCNRRFVIAGGDRRRACRQYRDDLARPINSTSHSNVIRNWHHRRNSGRPWICCCRLG